MTYKLLSSMHLYQIETQMNALTEHGWELHTFNADKGIFFAVMHKELP